MSKRGQSIKSVLFFVVLLTLSNAALIRAEQRIAIFPMEDISRGVNGYDHNISQRLEKVLSAKGLEVIPSQEVMSFLVRNRLRWLGYLETYHAMQAKEEMNADFLLLGTVIQQHESSSTARIGLSLQLIRTSDSRVVWSDSGGMSTADNQHFLGISEPETVDDLLPMLLTDIMATWPAEFEFTEMRRYDMDIESVIVEPKYVKPGDEIKCVVRLRDLSDGKERPQVFIKAGARVHLAMEVPAQEIDQPNPRKRIYGKVKIDENIYQKTEIIKQPKRKASNAEKQRSEGQQTGKTRENQDLTDTLRYEVSWVASEQGGLDYGNLDLTNNVATAMEDLSVLQSTWKETNRDDRYPVSLVVSYPSGKQRQSFLGYYHVDSRPPALSLDFKAKEIEGIPTFMDSLVIMPKIQQPEPISRWQIMVTNENGDTVVNESGVDSLPSRLTWKGKGSDGVLMPDGIYKVILKVWDRALNLSEATQPVSFRPTPPELILDTSSGEEKITLNLTQKKGVPVNFWRVELRHLDGQFYKLLEGEEFPAQIEISLSSEIKASKLECSLLVKNVLGGKTVSRIKDMQAYIMMKNGAEEEKTDPAIPDANKWHSDF